MYKIIDIAVDVCPKGRRVAGAFYELHPGGVGRQTSAAEDAEKPAARSQ